MTFAINIRPKVCDKRDSKSSEYCVRWSKRGIIVADQTCYLTQSQYIDTRPTSPNTDTLTLDIRQDSH